MNPTFEDLKEFIIVDKAVNACHKDVTAFLKERGPKKIKEVTELLRKYKSAHPDKQIAPARDETDMDMLCVAHTTNSYGYGKKDDRSSSRERNGTNQSGYINGGPRGGSWYPNDGVQQGLTVLEVGRTLSLHPGFIGESPVNVLQDSRSTIGSVRKDFV